MKTIEEFCNAHNACADGRAWAIANCKTMQDAWDTQAQHLRENTKPQFT